MLSSEQKIMLVQIKGMKQCYRLFRKIRGFLYRHIPECRKGRVRKMLSGIIEKGNGFNQDEYERLYQEIKENYREIRLHAICSGRIGEYIVRYLAAVIDSKKQGKDILDLFILDDYDNHNVRLSEIMGRRLCIVNERNVLNWERILQCFPHVEFERYIDDYNYTHNKNKEKLLEAKEVVRYFKITEEEEKEGEEKKRIMGLKGIYVCASSRDALYLKTTYPTRDCTYHDYRDSDINQLNLSAGYLSDKNIALIRMGRYVKDTVNFDNCIDYANHYYDELMDIILSRDCKFYVGDPNGLLFLPMVLNRPVAIKNMTPVFLDSESFPYNPFNLFIFKKYYIKSENRFLSIKEMMQAEKKCRYDGHKYAELGIEMIENSAEEILDLVAEMNERLDGKWVETTEDVDLQRQFQTICAEWWQQEHYQKGTMLRMRVGAAFLRDNRFLLD